MFYTQIVFISYILEKCFLYSSSRRLLYYSLLTRILTLFVFFFSRKILISFTCFFSKLLFVFFDNIYSPILCIKKNYQKYFLIFFIRIFFTRIFFMRMFPIKIRRNFYIINNTLKNLFFLTTYLNSSKNTWGW